MVQLSVIKMPAVTTHKENTIVPAILDMREMDLTALVNVQYIEKYSFIHTIICMTAD